MKVRVMAVRVVNTPPIPAAPEAASSAQSFVADISPVSGPLGGMPGGQLTIEATAADQYIVGGLYELTLVEAKD